MDTKPYISAGHAAELLGTTRQRVIDDVEAGMRGDVAALIGATGPGWCLVAAWEFEGDRLAMHRERFGQCS